MVTRKLFSSSVVEKKLEEIAKASEGFKNSKHAAGLVYKRKLLVTAVNSGKTHPLAARYYEHHMNQHAEFAAIIKGISQRLDFSKLSLYVCRVYRDGSLAESCPCEGCQELIRAVGFKKVYHSTKKGWTQWWQ